MGAPQREAPDLVGHIGSVVNHRIDVDQFWRWFVAAMPEIEDTGSDSLVDLAWLVEHRFAEYTSGYIDAACLVAELETALARADAEPSDREAPAVGAAPDRRGAAAR